ncbi:hypothetical protein MNBD_GAMMA01-734 [hydrothermal vent metagenome]|uniref:Uncharacterized protein n=1 Tax=hydrothermal vent metagenome TaxID=652676 RepID=A0A3B0VJ57_9ZZZZ
MKNNILKLNVDCTTYDYNNNIHDGDLPLIPSGKYEAVLNTWFTGTLWKQPKVVMIYTITSGEYFGVDIPKYYNVKRLKGKAGKKGKFIAKPRGDFLKDFYKLLPLHEKVRVDQIPVNKLKLPIEIKVSTVTKDHKQKVYAKQLQYSVIREVNILNK